MRDIPLPLVLFRLILPVNVLITINILLNVWKTGPELVKKPALPKPNVPPVWSLIQPALMMPTTKNVNATPARVMIIPMRKLRLRVMWLTEAAKAAQKQNTSAKKTPAPVTQLANAAVKSVLPSAIAALLKSLRIVKNAAMTLALREQAKNIPALLLVELNAETHVTTATKIVLPAVLHLIAEL